MLAFINEHFPDHCAMKQLLKLTGKKMNGKDTSSGELKNETANE